MSETALTPRELFLSFRCREYVANQISNPARQIIEASRMWRSTCEEELDPLQIRAHQVLCGSAGVDEISRRWWRESQSLRGTDLKGLLFHEPTVMPFLQKALDLAAKGELNAALREVYFNVHGLIRSGRIFAVRSLFSVTPDASTLDVFIGLLAASRPLRSRIPEWRRLHEQLSRILLSQNEDPSITLPKID